MKYTLATAAIVFAATAANASVTAFTTPSGRSVWGGDVFMTQTSSQCTSDQGKVGKFGQLMFEPKGLPGNSAKQDLIIVFPFGDLTAMQWVPVSATGQFNGAKTVAETTIDLTGLNTYTQSYSVTVSAPTPAPAKVGGSTVQISAVMSHKNGCVINLSGNLIGPF